jgi:acetyl-CoA carboxylase biotin carboxyl carrier protein
VPKDLAPSDGTDLSELREHTRRLAADLSGALRRVSVSSGDATIEVEWQPNPEPANGHRPVPADPGPAAPAPAAADEATPDGQPPGVVVTSPMVGTFYRAETPEAAPYVEVGSAVRAGQVIGIVEAMKLLNPITAESAGVVAEILVGNAQPVEFGQALVRLTEQEGG